MTQEVEVAGAQDGRDGQIREAWRWCCAELSGARGRDRDRESGEIKRSSAMALTRKSRDGAEGKRDTESRDSREIER